MHDNRISGFFKKALAQKEWLARFDGKAAPRNRRSLEKLTGSIRAASNVHRNLMYLLKDLGIG